MDKKLIQIQQNQIQSQKQIQSLNRSQKIKTLKRSRAGDRSYTIYIITTSNST